MSTKYQTLVAQLRSEGDPTVAADLADRYGIHTGNAVGIPIRRLKEIARPLGPNHDLALQLWTTGLYEARIVAAHLDDPSLVTRSQMNSWAHDFDNWAIVDTTCFQLFDKSPHAWSMLEPWATENGEFVKRAAFALLWALALHDKTAPDAHYRNVLPLIEANAEDGRHLVTKAQTMALRAIAKKRPEVRNDVIALATELAGAPNPNARKVGRPIVRAFAEQ